jgi:hypothetical protein
VYTNVGPLADSIDSIQSPPTPERPWIVQAYVDGPEVCTTSVAHHGRLTAHCTYLHPREIEHRGGIVLVSEDDPVAQRIVERLVEATGYHGCLGLDLRRGPDGLSVIECNPRPTSGVHLFDDRLVDAILAPGPDVLVTPAGVRRMYGFALWRDLALHWENAREDVAFLRSDVRDVFFERGDWAPAFAQLAAYVDTGVRRLLRRDYGAKKGTGLMAAYFDGITWDGQPIPG